MPRPPAVPNLPQMTGAPAPGEVTVRRRLLIAAALVALAGCQEHVFEPVQSSFLGVWNHGVDVPDQADILFVVDDSGSMAGEQENLATSFEAFVSGLDAENADRVARGKAPIDYRIAVTSTSVRQAWLDDAGNRQVVTTYQRDVGCNSAYPITALTTPYPDGTLMAAPGRPAILTTADFEQDRAGTIAAFQDNARVGTCGSGQEMGLLAMRHALEKQPDFVRPGSRLMVVLVSDEQDCSDPDGRVSLDLSLPTGEGACVQEAAKPDGGLLGPVSDYADFLRSTPASSVIVGTVVSAVPGDGGGWVPGICDDPACEAACAGADPRTDCWCGGQSPGSRYLELAGMLSGSLEDSVCEPDFSPTLRELARLVAAPMVPLEARPQDDDPSLVFLQVLRADGTTVSCTSPERGQTCADGGADWEYLPDPPTLRICEGSQCALDPGDRYRVSLVVQACTGDSPCVTP